MYQLWKAVMPVAMSRRWKVDIERTMLQNSLHLCIKVSYETSGFCLLVRRGSYDFGLAVNFELVVLISGSLI